MFALGFFALCQQNVRIALVALRGDHFVDDRRFDFLGQDNIPDVEIVNGEGQSPDGRHGLDHHHVFKFLSGRGIQRSHGIRAEHLAGHGVHHGQNNLLLVAWADQLMQLRQALTVDLVLARNADRHGKAGI